MLFCKKDVKELNLTVPDMHCTHCSAKIESTVKAVKGVKKVLADPKTKAVCVEYDASKCTPESVVSAIVGAGFTVND